MRAYYLQILGLTGEPSDQEIKKKYRQLVKKYHPDVSKEIDAEQKFIEIDQAYEYLTRRKWERVVPDINDDDVVRERRERIRKARAKAWEKRKAERAYQKKVLHNFSYFIGFVAVLNVFFLVDKSLPNIVIDERLQLADRVIAGLGRNPYGKYKITSGGAERYYRFHLEHHEIIISDRSPLPTSTDVELEISRIFGFSEALRYNNQVYQVYFSLYSVFSVVIYVVLIAAILYFHFENYYDFRFSMLALIIVMSAMQLVVYSSM